MGKFVEVKGDLIKMALNGDFDVVVHGCNCLCIMGAGIAPQMAKAFKCDTFDMESYIGVEKLGNIDYQTVVLGENAVWSLEDGKNNKDEPELIVVNAYTQYKLSTPTIPAVNYHAISLVLTKLNEVFKGKHIGLPLIGCGLAGGNWEVVKVLMQKNLTDVDVTVVHYTNMEKK